MVELESDRHPTVVLSAVAVLVAAVGFVIVAPGHALAARGDVETCVVERFEVAFHPDDTGLSMPVHSPFLDVVERVAWVSALVVVASHLASGLWWLRGRRRAPLR
ncbi:hypothetical protein GCM10027598_82730 [Amycolatopsis oliviviridis]|uniref:PDGLE domain-containing protein n=1 Tax=Amycolatopsis oliviviridis TaxID=1471590 RepID=A0ABQ3L7D7_9PSEU|nr:hypothetical protein [Amycolatopsis oliviviridis]GHH06738.1 hypothetical protein GCM10017790_12630 [Amycolatopsis oliviviridis]